MRQALPLACVLAVAALVPLGGPAAAGNSWAPAQIDVDETHVGADTYMVTVRTQDDGFEIKENSHLEVTADYTLNGSPATDESANVRGVVQYNTGLNCAPTGQADPCFMDATGVSIKDVWDVRADVGPLTVEQDPGSRGFSSATSGVWWDDNTTFHRPPTADQLTIRIFVSLPGADAIHVDLHVHSPDPISIHDETVTDTGFMASGEDFAPTAGADTAAASVMVDGRETVHVDGDTERLYAAFGPSWYGATAAGPIVAEHNTAAASNIAYEDPSGDRYPATGVTAGSWGGILVPGSEETGEHAFEVDAHAGLGPQDPYLVGWERPKG